MLEPWVTWSASLPTVFPVYLFVNMGPRGLLPTALPAPFSATLSLALSVYLCANVGPQGLLVHGLPAQFVPHSTSLSPATATRVLSAPVPISAPPTGLDKCFLFPWCWTSLPFDFSVSSGCARRRSVSTYAAILVFLFLFFESHAWHFAWPLVIQPFSVSPAQTLLYVGAFLLGNVESKAPRAHVEQSFHMLCLARKASLALKKTLPG